MSLATINYGAAQDQMHVVYDKINAAITFINANMNGIVPIGTVIPFTGTTAPTGWNLCDGTNGTDDLRGKFIVGYNPGDADYNALGNTGGAKTVTLSAAQSGLRDHQHKYKVDNSNTAGTGIFPVQVNGGGSNTIYANDTDSGTVEKVDGGSATGAQSATASHENRPPYYTLAYIQRIS